MIEQPNSLPICYPYVLPYPTVYHHVCGNILLVVHPWNRRWGEPPSVVFGFVSKWWIPPIWFIAMFNGSWQYDGQNGCHSSFVLFWQYIRPMVLGYPKFKKSRKNCRRHQCPTWGCIPGIVSRFTSVRSMESPDYIYVYVFTYLFIFFILFIYLYL
jgi:hypothetical protein